MPVTHRLARLLVATCLVVATWLSAAPAPASALEPPRPLPGYRPHFVTQRDEGASNDCLWASGSMLLEKWTNGRITRSHQQLRRMSGDERGGSLFPDLARAYRKLGIRLTWSPDGGERITWSGLLRRLKQGAGAIVLGDYADLPRHWGRWDYRFWKGKAKTDNHAMYIERYKHGRVWLMDPLANSGGWKGEWITLSALRRFVWTRGGVLAVAVTPKARPAPFAGVTVGELRLSMTGTTLEAAWALKTPRRWRFPGVDTKVAIAPAGDAVAIAAGSVPVTPPRKVDATAAGAEAAGVAPVAPPAPVTTGDRRALRVTTALPPEPGAYRADITLTDRRFGGVAAQVHAVALYVPGARRAALRLRPSADALDAGSTVAIEVTAENTGELTWGGSHDPGVLGDGPVARTTLMVAHWVPVNVPSASGGTSGFETPAAVVLPEAVPLAPGETQTIRAKLAVPEAPGTWAMVIDLEDDLEGSFAALGSAPAVRVYDVVARPGKTVIE